MVNAKRLTLLAGLLLLAAEGNLSAQTAPGMGYMFPAGGQAGQTVDVILGGYDWTPDMQLIVHDPRIRLEVVGKPGPVIVPKPPYWFGAKARRPPFLLPRETPARLTIPAGVEPGPIKWQAANANGATDVGYFVVGSDQEVIETEGSAAPLELSSLPVTVNGRIKSIEEIDRYRFTATKSGPVSCALVAQSIGSELNAVLQVRDQAGEIIAGTADTTNQDTALTFAATAGQTYTASLYDLDFRGNRAFVYRLSLSEAPRVAAAFPATAQQGTTQQVELVGYGIASGEPKLESVTREVVFPADGDSFLYRLDTPHGTAAPLKMYLSDEPVLIEPAENAARQLQVPVLLSGVLDERYGEDRYSFTAVKGQAFALRAVAREIGSPLDLSLAVFDAEGNELARSDDLSDSLDAELAFTAKADGQYQVGVSDSSGHSGSRAAVYQLELQEAQPDFVLGGPEMFAVPIGGQAVLSLTVTRTTGFKDAVPVTIEGLPEGIAADEKLETIPANQRALKIELSCGANAAASASLVKVVATAKIGERTVRREFGPVLIAATITPPFAIDAEGKDDVTKWPRGTTFPAPVLIERNEGFTADIVLEMTSKQGRHRQGIAGPELTVPPDMNRILYPVFLPEWLETTRTSRMVVNGVAQIKDPQGNVRYSLTKQKTRMGFLPVGALLKLDADVNEFAVRPGEQISVPLTISRARVLTQPLRLELQAVLPAAAGFDSQPLVLDAAQRQAQFPIQIKVPSDTHGDFQLTLRATTDQGQDRPVVSETKIIVQVAP